MRKIALQHCTQQLRHRHRPPLHQKLEQVTKLGRAGASIKKSGTWSQTSFRQIKKSRTWSATCLRPGLRLVGDLVSDKIDLMEFGHNGMNHACLCLPSRSWLVKISKPLNVQPRLATRAAAPRQEHIRGWVL